LNAKPQHPPLRVVREKSFFNDERAGVRCLIRKLASAVGQARVDFTLSGK